MEITLKKDIDPYKYKGIYCVIKKMKIGLNQVF